MDVFVGVDLAWTARGRTGLAVVDTSGRLVSSTVAVTDEEIVAWVERGGWRVVIAAVDAPLIVTNLSGQRDCEREISRAFGGFGASCHTSNRSRPYFDPPRGAVLAERLGWSLDPHAGRPTAIEVYPHPAMVGLFQLEAVLPYKAKARRPLERRREAFHVLADHLEGLAALDLGANARWLTLRGAIEGADRPVDLERAEDEIDAIFCAHLAWLWHHDPNALQMYGTVGEGFIVATPPPTHARSAMRSRNGGRGTR